MKESVYLSILREYPKQYKDDKQNVNNIIDLLQELKKEIRKERVSIALQYDDSLHSGSNYVCDIIDRIMENH